MVVTDTNIAAELMRAEPSPEVLAWMDDRPPRKLFVTAVTEAEVRTGIALLPASPMSPCALLRCPTGS